MSDHDQSAIRRYRVIAISHDQCVNTHGVEAIEDRAGALVYFGDHDAIASRLRAERDAAESKALAVHEVLTKEMDTLKADNERLRGLAKDIHTWLTDQKMETWMYHENGHFEEDRTKVVRRIDQELSQ